MAALRLMLATILISVPVNAQNGYQPPGPALIDSLVNPVLANPADIRSWRSNYAYRLTSGVESGKISEVDQAIARRVGELSRLIDTAGNANILPGLYIWCDRNDPHRSDMINQIRGAQVVISQYFRNRLDLPQLPGLFFVFVVGETPPQDGQHQLGFALRGTRIMVLNKHYYSDQMLRLFDRKGFYETARHEFVHAYINAYAGYYNSMGLQGWFHEMAATHISGARLFSTSGESVSRMPEHYRRYRNAARYLIDRYGEADFYRFMIHALASGKPEVAFEGTYPSETYRQFHEDRLSRFVELPSPNPWQIDNPLNLLLIPALLVTLVLLKYGIWTYVDGVKGVAAPYHQAVALSAKQEEIPALTRFREFAELAADSRGIVRLFSKAEMRGRFAEAQAENIQQRMIQSQVASIDELVEQQRMIEAEAALLNLKDLSSEYFDPPYRQRVERFFDGRVTKILADAWMERDALIDNGMQSGDFEAAAALLLEQFESVEAADYLDQRVAAERLQQVLQKWFPQSDINIPIPERDDVMESLRRLRSMKSSPEIRTVLKGYFDRVEIQQLRLQLEEIFLHHFPDRSCRDILVNRLERLLDLLVGSPEYTEGFLVARLVATRLGEMPGTARTAQRKNLSRLEVIEEYRQDRA